MPPPAPTPTAAPAANHGACGNCGKPLLGPYCYACGQPVRGLVRHFSSIAGDFVDTVLNWDARLPRTLWPLLVRPAHLTREYFAGRRVRYVSPVRLFVTLAIVTFFVAQLMLSFGDEPVHLGGNRDAFDKAKTEQEVVRQRDAALAEMEKARGDNSGVPGLSVGLRQAEKAIRASADQRIAELRKSATPAADAAEAADAAASATPREKPAPSAKADAKTKDAPDERRGRAGDRDDDDGNFNLAFDGEDWDEKTHPIAVSWLPQFGNDGLNTLAKRAQRNIERWRQDPDQFKDALLSAVPSTLFLLLPVFALMLKLLYVFKRRLYMEHLIVALHSHAFLCLALLLTFLAMALQNWLTPDTGVLHTLFGLLEAALWIWMPLYLLLMQKRVYGQGWLMTLLKYSVLGGCYFFLLLFGAIFTVMFSVIWG